MFYVGVLWKQIELIEISRNSLIMFWFLDNVLIVKSCNIRKSKYPFYIVCDSKNVATNNIKIVTNEVKDMVNP